MIIKLNQILPPFEGVEGSQIWANDLILMESSNYLINAVSGKGKSTFVSYLIGERDDFSGDLSYKGIDSKLFTNEDWNNLRTESLACVFQNLHLFEDLSVIDNIDLKNNLTSHLSVAEIDAMLLKLDILNLKNQTVKKLSVGQKQRVAIIRAFAQPFKFIILDEPFSHLDERNIELAIELLEKRCKIENGNWIITTLGDKYGLINYQELKL